MAGKRRGAFVLPPCSQSLPCHFIAELVQADFSLRWNPSSNNYCKCLKMQNTSLNNAMLCTRWSRWLWLPVFSRCGTYKNATGANPTFLEVASAVEPTLADAETPPEDYYSGLDGVSRLTGKGVNDARDSGAWADLLPTTVARPSWKKKEWTWALWRFICQHVITLTASVFWAAKKKLTKRRRFF